MSIADQTLVTPTAQHLAEEHRTSQKHKSSSVPQMQHNDPQHPAKKRRTESVSSNGSKHTASPRVADPAMASSATSPSAPSLAFSGECLPENAHNKRTPIFTQTRSFALYRSSKVYATSSRGFQRELPPTRQTRPPLRKRRHSVDVNTIENWADSRHLTAIEDATVTFSLLTLAPVPTSSHETDEPVRHEPTVRFPNALRYRELNTGSAWGLLHNEKDSNKVFLELQKSIINYREAQSIPVLTFPDCWFTDNVLDTALEMISMEYDAQSHGICIANSLMGQLLYFPGIGGDSDGDGFAGMAEYTRMFTDKRWIFIPINDGFVAKDTSSAQGAHWSLLAVDRGGMTAHYIDSLFKHDRQHRELGKVVATGLGNILNEEYTYQVERHAPNQWKNNKYNGCNGHDLGPCGPFVYTMIEIYANWIIDMQKEDREGELSLSLSPCFPRQFQRFFDSLEIRYKIVESMANLKANLESDKLAAEHDATVLADRPDVQFSQSAPPLFETHHHLVHAQDSDETQSVGCEALSVVPGDTDSEEPQKENSEERWILVNVDADTLPVSLAIQDHSGLSILEDDESVHDIRLSPVQCLHPTNAEHGRSAD